MTDYVVDLLSSIPVGWAFCVVALIGVIVWAQEVTKDDPKNHDDDWSDRQW